MGLGIALLAGVLLYFLSQQGERKGISDAGVSDAPLDAQLSKNFRLSEFLRSRVMPSLKNYRPSLAEFSNLQTLVDKVLQPLRDQLGPITITHGGRPPLTTPQGVTFAKAMLAAGYKPARNSDHARFAAADFVMTHPELLPTAFMALQDNPFVRQIIAYQEPGEPINLIHVAVVHPGYGRLSAPKFATVVKG